MCGQLPWMGTVWDPLCERGAQHSECYSGSSRKTAYDCSTANPAQALAATSRMLTDAGDAAGAEMLAAVPLCGSRMCYAQVLCASYEGLSMLAVTTARCLLVC